MEKMTLKVAGMSCEHCVGTVKSALTDLPGITDVDINLTDGTIDVAVDSSKTTLETIRQTIYDAGYDVIA